MRKEYYFATNTAAHYPYDGLFIQYSQNTEEAQKQFEEAQKLMTAHLQKTNDWSKQNFGEHHNGNDVFYICHFWDGRYNRSGQPIFSVIGVGISEREAKKYTLKDFSRVVNQSKTLLKLSNPNVALTAFDLADQIQIKWNNVPSIGSDLYESNLSSRFVHTIPTHSPILKRVDFEDNWQDAAESTFVDLDEMSEDFKK